MKTNIYSKLYSEHRAWDKHCYDDPGYVSRTTHAQQLVNWPGQVEQNTARGTSTDLTSGGWANALSGAEMKAIATTAYTDGKNPCSAVPGPPTDPSLQQWQRGVKPVCFMDVEQGTRGNRGLGFLCGWPGLYVCKGSTAFTNLGNAFFKYRDGQYARPTQQDK
eukprot:COSAG02_NODE_615_length_19511_cov_64.132701_7_plen_163_part_00